MNALLKMQLRDEIKTSSKERPDDKPLHILCKALMETKYEANYRDVNNFRQVMYRGRLKAFRRPPKSKQEALAKLKSLADADHDLVRKVSGDVVMLARRKDLPLLQSSNLQLFADGTFKYSPSPFKQMYSFHIFKKGFYVPIAHFLVFDKTYKTYKKALNLLISTCREEGVALNQDLTIMVDFELAMIKALKEMIPSAAIKGCRFHLHQSWWRKIQSLGLAPLYKDAKNRHGRWLRGIYGMSLLPPEAVQRVFNNYTSSRTLQQPPHQMTCFIQYLKTNYIGPLAVFTPSMWSGAGDRVTNNGAEAFHRHFGDLFGYLRCNPTVWHFLRNLKILNVLKDVKLRSSRAEADSNSATEVAHHLELYNTKKITSRALLYTLCKKNQPKIKKNSRK